MEGFVRKLKIQSLKAQIDEKRQFSTELARGFERIGSSEERTRTARCFDDTLKQMHAMQLMLELLERHEREAVEEAAW